MTTTLARLTAALLVVSLTLACATTKEKVDDPTYVQTLRIKITKVRNAVEETRNTIALSRGAPYLPELYVRLAELLSEEARYHYRLAYEREQRSSRVLHVPQVRVLKEEAITIYNSILQRFPKTPLAARVLFNIGHEHRELGNFDDMRKTLDKLVDNYPDSPLRSDALLVLGDYHFDRTELTQAERYYALLIKSPLNRVTGLGHYKQAWVWVNQGKCKRALVDFEKAIVRSKAWEELEAEQAARAADLRSATEEFVGAAGVTQQAIDVRRESLVDMAYCYSRERPVRGAVAYFRRMAYNRGTYLAALDKLASRYRLIDNAEGAIGTTRELLRLGSASLERLDDARTLYTAVKRAKRYSKLDLDVKLISQTYTRHSSRLAITDDTRQRLEEEFEAYIRDLVTDAQERIPKLKKGGDKAKIARARVVANAYQTYAETFPNSPELANMLLNQTEMLTKAGDHLTAGLAAARASDLLGDGPERQTALYDAVVAFQTSLEQPVDRRRYERVTARAALRRTARELLRFPLEPDRDRRVKFAIAQTYFDEGNHRAAIDQLSAVAYAFPNTKEGDASIELILDSYTTTNDTDGLIAAGRRFVAAESPASDGLKGRIGPFIAAAEQTKLDELSLSAAGEEGGGLEVLENFAQQNQGSELGERAILNAFVVARAQGNTQKMQELAGTIANTYPKSDQLPGIYASMAQTAVARFAYDQAVDSLRQAATANPSQRTRLLMAAGELQEQLGDFKGAQNSYLEALKAAEGPGRTEAMARLASVVEGSGNANTIVSTLGPLADSAPPELNARLGLAQLALGQREEAEQTLQRAMSADAAGGDARARAEYGQAEVLLAVLQNYPEVSNLDQLEEFIALIEVVEESYLNAAQQATPAFAAASLARLAHASNLSAGRLRRLSLPGTELSADEKTQIQEAMKARAENLDNTAKQALEACANQAWQGRLFTPIVRQCLAGKSFKGGLIPTDRLQPRSPKQPPQGIDDLRQRLSKNPEDVEGLRELGIRFLDAGDPHVARLIFARAIQAGGGATEHNLLGIASAKAGDLSGAFEAFSQAASSGLEAGRQNLLKIMSEQGLNSAAAEVNKRYPEGEAGGRLL